MSDYLATCDICDHEQTVYHYLDWECDGCGQRYTYNEGHKIELSPRQLMILRHTYVEPWWRRVWIWWVRRRDRRYHREQDRDRLLKQIQAAELAERDRVLMIAREQLGLHHGEAWQDVHACIARAANEPLRE